MKKINIILWYISTVLLAFAVYPFIQFMFNTQVKTLVILIVSILIPTSMYVITTKKITHPQHGYTAIQAVKFYKQCKAKGLDSIEIKEKTNRAVIKEIAQKNEYSKNLEPKQLIEMYSIGCSICEKTNKEK